MASQEKKQKERMIECSICVMPSKEKNCFRCFSCKEEYCIKCLKTYLLGSSQDPHCLHCRNAIDYNTFIEKFDKTWRLGPYKEHREKILWDIEQSMIPATVGYIDTKKRYKEAVQKRCDYYQLYLRAVHEIASRKRLPSTEWMRYEKDREKYHKLYIEANQISAELFAEINDFKDKKKKMKYKWSQPCPNKDCKGFMNEKYECPICEKTYCKDCLEEKKPKEEHTCNEELVETVKMIRKESKPCPTCGEFISKISGCDQMFCTGCGTAFSWKTGEKEMGVIHNPHAHQYFRENPEALEMYRQQRNGETQPGAGGGNCRPFLPTLIDQKKILKNLMGHFNVFTMTDEEWVMKQMVDERLSELDLIHRRVAEYHAYSRNMAYQKIFDTHQENLDIREKFIMKEMDEKKFKMVLHMRSKRNQFRRLVHQLFESTILIVAGLIWSMTEVKTIDELVKMYDMLMDIKSSTNTVIRDLSEKHNYKEKVEIQDGWRIPTYWA